jgi:hypothetical protein
MGGAFFLFFGAPTLAFIVTTIRAKSPMVGIKAERSLRLLLHEKRLLQQIFLNPQNSYFLGRRTFEFIIRLCGLNFRPVILHF